MDDNIVPISNRKQESWEQYFTPNGFRRLQEEAIVDAVREHTKDLAKNKQKFNDLVTRSKKVLFKLKTVFPFDFFPSTITIDQEKITVKFGEFFFSNEVRSIYIKNIAQLYVDCGPFFATMNLLDQVILDERSLIKIPFLKKKEAFRARRIIQGLQVAHGENIDIAKIQDEDIIPKLESLGTMR